MGGPGCGEAGAICGETLRRTQMELEAECSRVHVNVTDRMRSAAGRSNTDLSFLYSESRGGYGSTQVASIQFHADWFPIWEDERLALSRRDSDERSGQS
jgi:hypothetical protein